ncbi:hypothetical protein Dimus_027504, partial [Dionaea muscipula]
DALAVLDEGTAAWVYTAAAHARRRLNVLPVRAINQGTKISRARRAVPALFAEPLRRQGIAAVRSKHARTSSPARAYRCAAAASMDAVALRATAAAR